MRIGWVERHSALTDKESTLANSLSRMYATWVKELSGKEIHAIRKYTKNSLKENRRFSFFKRLNHMLESENPEAVKEYRSLKEYADIISGALRKCPVPQGITCYRGVDDKPVEGIGVGDKFVYRRFVSTSLFKKHAFKRKYLLVIHIPAGTNAAYIDDISRYKGQFEVLIDKGYRYRLLSIQGNTYEMEVCEYD